MTGLLGNGFLGFAIVPLMGVFVGVAIGMRRRGALARIGANAYVAVLIVIVTAEWWFWRQSRSSMDAFLPSSIVEGLVWVAVGVAIVPAVYLGEMWIMSAGRKVSTTTAAVAQSAVVTPVWFWGITVFTVLPEEMLWRGIWLDNGLGHTVAVPIQALGYALTHTVFGARAVIAKGATGLLLGVLAVVSGGFLVTLVTHAGFQVLTFRSYRRRGKVGRPVIAGA